MLHWLNTELWGPMWPNMFAPSLITLVAVCVSHLKARRHRDRQMAEAARHHAEATAQRTAHHEALKAHITAQGRPVSSVAVEPQQMAEVAKAAERTKKAKP